MVEYDGKKFWESRPLREKYPDAQIFFALGERSDGKSFDLKSFTIEESLMDENKKFFILRRFKTEITRPKLRKYYNNLRIWTPEQTLSDYTNGMFNRIECAFGEVLAINTETKQDKVLGYYGALEDEQDFAGFSMLDVKNIVFEEAISRTRYLQGEPDKLMNFYSTIDRRRGTTKLFMLGNPLGKYIPYFVDWGMSKYSNRIEQGKMQCFYIPTPSAAKQETMLTVATRDKKDYVKLAWEWIEPSGSASYVVGKHAAMLANGSFQTDVCAKLNFSYKEARLIKRLVFEFDDVHFIAEYRVKKNARFWFVYPKTKKSIKDKTRVISNRANVSRYYSTRLEGKTEQERELFREFNASNVFYATDDCGTYFNQLLLNYLKLKL